MVLLSRILHSAALCGGLGETSANERDHVQKLKIEQ